MSQIKIIKGDITKIKVDAIVNAANKHLLGGAGVDGAIHFAAGQELLEECKGLNGCNPGESKITRAYNLPAKYVIHTVGPFYGAENGLESTLLSSCYIKSLELAVKYNIKTISFPSISTGSFRYPKDQAAIIAYNSVTDFLKNNQNTLDEIFFVLFDELNYKIYDSIHNNGGISC